jgi:uncharacterized protein (DUF2235 family)
MARETLRLKFGERNVWRVFQPLDLTGSDQVAIYDDGVGTSSFKPLALLGGAFGWGLKRNVIDLYKFVCRNYGGPEDEIFGFGFSRGAFTIRIVIGLLADQGLVPYESEEELHRTARDAYRAFRRKNFHTVWRIEKSCDHCYAGWRIVSLRQRCGDRHTGIQAVLL